jgi:hypothetical protein
LATSVRLDPLTGLPATRVIRSPSSGLRFGSFATASTTSPPGPGSGSVGYVPGTSAGYSPTSQYAHDIWDYAYEHGTAAGAPELGNPGQPPRNSGGGGGGGPPIDYAALVANDPGLRALRAELAAGNISAAQFRKAAIQKAVIAYGRAPAEGGMDPSTLGYYKEDVDQLTKDLAAKNTSEGLSTVAQQDRAHQVAIQGLQNVLAARGMLQSGGLGVGLGLEGQRDKTDQAKAVGSLLDYLSGQAQAYAEHLHQSKLQEAQAIMDTTMAYMQTYAGGMGGGGGGGGGSRGGLENPDQFRKAPSPTATVSRA